MLTFYKDVANLIYISFFCTIGCLLLLTLMAPMVVENQKHLKEQFRLRADNFKKLSDSLLLKSKEQQRIRKVRQAESEEKSMDSRSKDDTFGVSHPSFPLPKGFIPFQSLQYKHPKVKKMDDMDDQRISEDNPQTDSGSAYGGEFGERNNTSATHGFKNKNDCVGPPGPPGEDGFDGFDGEPGAPGASGLDASWDDVEQCTICPKGPRGPPGETGERGPQVGMAGTPGTNGEPGSPGTERGDPGPPGTTGEPGEKGPPGRPAMGGKGSPGPPGQRGSTGGEGERGVPGRNLSVRGPPGKPGEPGPRGDEGPHGEDGEPGDPGPPGADTDYCPCPPRNTLQDAPEFVNSAASQDEKPGNEDWIKWIDNISVQRRRIATDRWVPES